ncbi:hypothetical protein [Saliphagus sp. LR7]|uniref:hypothetical protein n=1 Tax=Saliphagus sp. LR7 TaxID=2282654 RepID=UPI000DF7BE72|nr:hypothetical protein [Saliphagus sp. LR7]
MSAIDDHDHPIPDRIVERIADDHNLSDADLHNGIKTIDETDGIRAKIGNRLENEDGWEILKDTRFATYYLVNDDWVPHLTNDNPDSPSDMTQALEQCYKQCIIAKVSGTIDLDCGFVLSN